MSVIGTGSALGLMLKVHNRDNNFQEGGVAQQSLY